MKWSEEQTRRDRPLSEALRLQQSAAEQGFDWPNIEPLWDKLQEEITELREAVEEGETGHIQSELGDLFFVLVNFSRFLKLDPAAALDKCNRKFIQRLRSVENALDAQNRQWEECSMDELEALWQAAKRV